MANCQDIYEQAITNKHEKLLLSRIKQKKALIRTGAGVGVPTAVFFGIMFKLITDGATIPAAILTGTMFGTVAGGVAVGAVAIPMITYNQIIKAEIRGLKHARELLNEAQAQDVDGKQLNRMLKKLRKKDSELEINSLIEAVNEANKQNVFCPEGERPDYLYQIRKYLRPADAEASQEELLYIDALEA